MAHPVARFEIAATDLKVVRAFYTSLFDWAVPAENPGKYAVVDPGEGVKGMIFRADAGIPTFVTFYVEVDDVDAYLVKAEKLGGTVYVPPTPSPIEGEKFFAVFGDPEGNIVGLVQR
jgi:uncharacterized protein